MEKKIKIAVLCGHKRLNGSNYNISKMLADKIGNADVEYVFLNDTPFCKGCALCIEKGNELCPHHEQIDKIVQVIDASDILIINCPTYCMEMTAQLKAFFDHLAYRFLLHRPNPEMRKKSIAIISTCAGGGSNRVIKSINYQMVWWGNGKTYNLSQKVFSSNWAGVSSEIKKTLDKKTSLLAKRITKNLGRNHQSLKSKFLAFVMKQVVKKIKIGPDYKYWQDQGWIK